MGLIIENRKTRNVAMSVWRDNETTKLIKLWREENLGSVHIVLGCGMEARSRAKIKENSKRLSSLIAIT